MKLHKFEKLLLIKLYNESKINFEDKYNIFIETIYLKLLKISKKSFNFNFNYNYNFKEKI